MNMRSHVQPQHGAFIVEFAMVLLIFLILAFGVIELARIMYVFNTLEEVTRRAASAATNTDFSDASAMSAVRQGAVFRNSPGLLTLGAPITDAHVRIDYMSLIRAGTGSGNMTLSEIPTANLPSCVATNKIVCMNNPNDPHCIRFVRVRICDPIDTNACSSVQYQTIASIVGMQLNLLKATRIVAAESLGFKPGMTPCP